MKLLFDQNLHFKLVRLLADKLPDAAHVRLLGLEQADHSTLWSYARLYTRASAAAIRRSITRR
jgi:predicted nuclease of predicted toxin-antitoxin system